MANYCDKCGKPINPDDIFCNSCGTQVNDSKMSETPRVLSFINHNPFVSGFGEDRFLFVQCVAAILLLAISKIAGFYDSIGERRMSVYTMLIPIGVIFVSSVQIIYYFMSSQESSVKGTIKQTAKDMFIPRHLMGWILIIINIILTIIIIIISTTNGYEAWQIIDEFFVGIWEQLIFANLSMTLIVQSVRLAFRQESFARNLLSFLIPLIVIDLCFGFAHWWAYGGDLATIAVLTVTGLLFMGIGYRYPSIGITLHWGYNTIVTLL